MGVAEEGEGSQSAVGRLVEALRRLNDDLQVPSPKAYGIERARYDALLATMASQALASGSPANNPRVPTSEEIVELYRRVYD
jgi:alcohol dehydrogenase class IV